LGPREKSFHLGVEKLKLPFMKKPCYCLLTNQVVNEGLFMLTNTTTAGKGPLTAPAAAFGLSMFAAIFVGLYFLSRANYLLFHSLVEAFSIIVACGVFMISWNSRRFHQNGFFLFIGVAFLFVAGVDLLHTLAYKNMGVFPEAGANLPTQLWIVARYLEAAALLFAPFYLSRRAPPALLFGGCLAVTAVLLAAVFGGLFPDCFREGTGLTPFKIGSEYLICLLLIASLVLMRRRRQAFDSGILRLLSLAVGALILAELSFTLYTDVFGLSNMAGHLFKVAGFYCIYRGVIETGLDRPFDLLFRDLKESEERLADLNAELANRADALEEANTELEASNDELEKANLELELINDRLETANNDLEAFNYSVSHDLRGPLTIINSQCQVILRIFADKVDSEVKEFIQGIHNQTLRMNDLITTLLDFSRLGKVPLQRQRIDLSPMAKGVAMELAMRKPDRLVSVDIAEGLQAQADPALMQVLLENLLGNAWKYTGKVEEARIEFGQDDVSGKRTFFVRDNGVGFDPANAGDLFNPFKRLDSAGFEGFGIGLATVKRIVERHGGEVWAEGVPEKGATFFFTV
jgi:signal transduction histidine kinase